MLFTQKLFQDFVAGFDTLGYAPGTPAPAGGLAFLLGGKFRQVFCDSLDLPTTFGSRIWTTERKLHFELIYIKGLFSSTVKKVRDRSIFSSEFPMQNNVVSRVL